MSKLDDILGKPNAKVVIGENNVLSIQFNTPVQKQEIKVLILMLMSECTVKGSELTVNGEELAKRVNEL